MKNALGVVAGVAVLMLAGCGEKEQELPKGASLNQPFASSQPNAAGENAKPVDPMARQAERSAREMQARYNK